MSPTSKAVGQASMRSDPPVQATTGQGSSNPQGAITPHERLALMEDDGMFTSRCRCGVESSSTEPTKARSTIDRHISEARNA